MRLAENEEKTMPEIMIRYLGDLYLYDVTWSAIRCKIGFALINQSITSMQLSSTPIEPLAQDTWPPHPLFTLCVYLC